MVKMFHMAVFDVVGEVFADLMEKEGGEFLLDLWVSGVECVLFDDSGELSEGGKVHDVLGVFIYGVK